MRLYYEATEVLPDDIGESEFIRIDVTDMDDQEKSDVLQAIKAVMSGKVYKLKEHQCFHDEGKDCVSQEI